MYIPLEEKSVVLNGGDDVHLSIQGQDYSNRSAAERTGHSSVKILIQIKWKWLTDLKNP